MFPTVLSYLGRKEKIKSFGKNLFGVVDSTKYVLNRSSGVYYLYGNEGVYEATLDESKGYYLYTDSLKENNMIDQNEVVSKWHKEVKARYQVYKDVFSTNSYLYNN